jgi:Uma2 family endonuclease
VTETSLKFPIMAATTHLMTVAEFQSLPEDSGSTYHELRHGEIVTVTRPKLKHSLIQTNLLFLLKPLADPAAHVSMEVAFRPLPDHELWAADVAYLSAERFRQSDPEGNIDGAPDLVIEVLSSSNTAAEILDKEQICLANGAKEFWVVDPEYRRIKVTTRDGRTAIYVSGDRVLLALFAPDAWLKVDDVFRY